MPNGNTDGPDLRGPRGMIWLAFVLLCAVLLAVLNEVTGRALWGY